MGARPLNPFEIFGITPEMSASLKEKDLFALIRVLYRGLQKVYHPDRSGTNNPRTQVENAARAVELNLAFEELNLDRNPESFRRHRKSYSARKRSGLTQKISELEKAARETQADRNSLADGYMSYLVRQLPWLSSNGGDPGHTCPAPTNIRVGLNDVAINQNVKSVSWSIGSNYKELVFDPEGTLFYRPVGRSKPFQANFIHILGVVDTGVIDLIPLLDRKPPKEGFFKSPALDSRYGIDGAPLEVLNTISLDKFKRHCLPLLRPDFKERAYLFSIHRPLFEKDGRISLEGVIVKLSNP